MNDLLAILIRYQYSLSNENGNVKAVFISEEAKRPETFTSVHFQCELQFQHSLTLQYKAKP